LTKIKGIGTWTANIYLMEALLRTDIFPSNDLALLTAIQSVKKLKDRPTVEEAEQMSNLWKPWRAVAARMFWHDYLSRRNEKIGV
jgi:DNA-3-methyladenine glycosylase II